jgi:hypothetical protein
MVTATDKTNKETLTPWQRRAELLTVAAMLLLLGFFAYHQWANTGFFTSKFGRLEMLALYGPIVVSLAAPITRMFTGRRNPARWLDAMMSLCLAVGSLWLWKVFPFNFSHLTDPFPAATRFVLAWISNDIGKAVLLLQVIVSVFSAITTMARYFAVRRDEEGGE